MVLGFESSRGGEKDLCFLERDLDPSSSKILESFVQFQLILFAGKVMPMD
jgi:hypothetical protein